MIKAADLIAKAQYVLDQKWGYIWGTAGTMWTEARQKALEKTTDADRKSSREYGAQWIGHMVTDCSGLFSWAFAQLGGYMYHGSNTMYSRYCVNKGRLINGFKDGKEPLKPGTAVFTGDAVNHGHVGLFIGGNEVIEASGPKSGVIKSRLTASKWTYWGELIGVDYSAGSSDGSSGEKPDTRPTLKRGSRGEFVTLLQTTLINRGYDVGPLGADGDFGRCTQAAVVAFQQANGLEADGIVGRRTWAALDASQSVPAASHYTATITGLTKDQVTALLKAYPKADVTEERG